MNIVYYIVGVLVTLVVGIVYLAGSKNEPSLWSSIDLCPRCGTRMLKQAGARNHSERVCPCCRCHSDEFGNSL